VWLALQQEPNSPWAFSAWVLPGLFLLYIYYSGVYATIQDIVAPQLRGTAMAVYFFAMYLLGGAVGPIVTGWISDHFAQQARLADPAITVETAKATGLHDAMYIIPILSSALLVVLLAASRTVTADYCRLHGTEGKEL
jgi:MFS family permease